MSLLKNVLRKNSATTSDTPAGLSQKSKDSLFVSTFKKSADAISLKSAGGISVHSVRSIAESVTSFTSALFNGKRIPKRRRPEISTLGLPKWYNKDPPAPPEMPGTEKVDLTARPYTCAHAFPLKAVDAKEEDKPYCCLVLYSYADSSLTHAKYYDDAVVRGELRLFLSKPDSISSVDVWVIGRAESVFSVADAPMVRYHANLWNRKDGAGTLGDQLPTNRTLIFPFEFPVFPKDVVKQKQDSTNVTRVPLPPTFKFNEVGHFSGEVKYYVAIYVRRSGMMSFDDSWKIPFFYYQLRQPIPREPTTFPFISDREDWPFKREEIGGWTITPFGGRGRFRDEMVEIEGLLGVQAPEVYAPGQTLRWSILLWSKNIAALEAISDPSLDCIDVVFLRSTMYGRDVLQPKNASRRNRNLQRASQGRVWRTADGPLADDVYPPLRGPPRPSGWANHGAAVEGPADTGPTPAPKSPVATSPKRSRFQDVITAEDEEDEEPTQESAPETKGSPSPASSMEDLPDFPDMAPQEATVRLDGDVRIPEKLGPSFRYMWMGREYVLQVTFTHPEYSHISPSAPGIYAETPIWLVTGMPKLEDPRPDALKDDSYLRELPVVGETIPLGTSPYYADLAKGAYSTQDPSGEVKRVVTF